MANIAKQIIGSFEDIGKDVARETVKVPKDLVGKALESLGTSSQKSQTTPTVQMPTTKEKKPMPPRQWLAELAGTAKKQREPTVQEIHQKEEQEKKEKEAKQAGVARQMAPLPKVSTKPRRGQLPGLTNASLDTSKNVRQD